MTIRFVKDGADALSVIEIETPVHARGLEALWRTFFALRVQIISAQVRVVETGRLAQRVRVCDFDGAPLEPKRQREIHSALVETFGLGPVPRAAPDGAEAKPGAALV